MYGQLYFLSFSWLCIIIYCSKNYTIGRFCFWEGIHWLLIIYYRGGVHQKLSREAVVDYLKGICIIFVILLHTNLFDTSKPIYLLFLNQAVPIFMILSGYVLGLSMGGRSFQSLYCLGRLTRKFLRFTIPMLVAFFLYFVGRIISGSPMSVYETVKCFCLGEYGPGAYYYALMIEFMVLSPVLVFFVDKWKIHGVVLAGLVNFLFEICSNAYSLHIAIYRVIILRYLFAVVLGIYIGMYKDEEISNKSLVTMLVIGIFYILLPVYWNYEYQVFNQLWAKTSMVSVLYVFPLVYILLRHTHTYTSKTWIGKGAEIIGQASYHIMYTQMIYFVVRPSLDKHIFNIATVGNVVEILVDVLISVISGIIFWYVDQRFLTGFLLKHLTIKNKTV